MLYPRMLSIENYKPWSEHQRGGWRSVLNKLIEHLHNPKAKIDLFTNLVERKYIEGKEVTKRPWVGVLHMTPGDGIMKKFVSNPTWRKCLKNCKGLYTLSNYVKEAIRPHVSCPVQALYYPVETAVPHFDPHSHNWSVLFIGDWLRNFEDFYALKTSYRKVLLNCRQKTIQPRDDVEIVPRVDNDTYDQLLVRNIVFLSLKDASANNTVVECIVRNTPLVVNRLPALQEYLGVDYPLFYDTPEEAHAIIENRDRILAGHKYLKSKDKKKCEIDSFIGSLVRGSVFRGLVGVGV